MICAACGRVNREDAKFCDGCGTRISFECLSCGRPLVAGLSRCEACGARVAEPAAKGRALQSPLSSGVFVNGRYRIGRFLGEGRRKRVYLARDERVGREVALALFDGQRLDAETWLRVEREAEAMALLGEHPRIVFRYDRGREAGVAYVVSRFMSGGGLEERVARHPLRRLPAPDALRLVGDLAEALEHAHGRGVI